jgi:hypothetical protein
MGMARQLWRVTSDPGFSRLKRTTARGGSERWELWLKDGVLHVLEGPTREAVLEQALELIVKRGTP